MKRELKQIAVDVVGEEILIIQEDGSANPDMVLISRHQVGVVVDWLWAAHADLIDKQRSACQNDDDRSNLDPEGVE